MDYFSKFLRSSGQAPPQVEQVDHTLEFHTSWTYIKETLLHPDERQLTRGIQFTNVPAHLRSMVDALVWESTRTEEGGTGACLEYLLKNDVLGSLVKLSEADRPSGIQAEVLRSVQNMVVLMDEQFLVHSNVHRAVLRLLRNCVGDDIQEQLDGRNRTMGAAGNLVRGQPSEYEEDLVNLLCILCSRIRNYRELLMIFFHDKQWYRPEPLFTVDEEEGDEDEDEDEDGGENVGDTAATRLSSQVPSENEDPFIHPAGWIPSPSSPKGTVRSALTEAPSLTSAKKPEYEFLLFNYLLRFVHREGQIGDFARAGLLFLLDVAMSPGETAQKETGLITVTGVETEPNPDAALTLAEYILDGDFSEVLAAGLAAVYSILPTKLEVSLPAQSETPSGVTMVLGATSGIPPSGQGAQDVRGIGIEESSDPEFKTKLDHFLKLLEFLQDVLRRNAPPDPLDGTLEASQLVGSAIAQSILDAVRRVFFENVLYPSILECSDSDGSAIAVMSYIDITLRTLGTGQLGDLLVDFLMSEDNTEDLTRSRMRPQSLLDLDAPPNPRSVYRNRSERSRRRKSTAMALLEMEAPDTRRPSEYFTSMGRFTVKDLLLSSLRSPIYPTVTAATQLLQSLMQIYCQVCVDRLLIVLHDSESCIVAFPGPPTPHEYGPGSRVGNDVDRFIYPGAQESVANAPSSHYLQPNATFYTHERELGMYLALVSRIDPHHAEDAFSTGYEHYLRDALLAVQYHHCFQAGTEFEFRERAKHRLNPHDPILSSLLESLRKFFANTPEVNMALTGALAALALCPCRLLAGWLTFLPNNPHSSDLYSGAPMPNPAGDGDDRSIDYFVEENLASESHSLPTASMDEQSKPVVYSVYHGLVTQLERYRQTVDEFDKYLLERRQGLLFDENLTDALSLALEFEGVVALQAPPMTAVSPPETAAPKSTTRVKSSSLVSFLTSKKNKPQKSTPGPPAPRVEKTLNTSPFGPHYERTNSIVVEPFAAPSPSSGPWKPAKPKKWSAVEDEVFTSSAQWGGDDTLRPDQIEGAADDEVVNVTLSRLLDNVVILEESIKEMAAIIHARRSLGVDTIRYL